MPKQFRLFLLVALLWTLTDVGITLLADHRGFPAAWEYLRMPAPLFDFTDYQDRFHFIHSNEFFLHSGYRWYYPAAAIFAHAPFYLAPAPIPTYLTFALVANGLAALLWARSLRAPWGYAYALAALLLSWPLYFALQRGNIEAFTWLLVAAGLWAFCSRRPALSAALLGLAASIKIYPVLFAALFLPREQRRHLLPFAISFSLLTLAGLFYLDPNIFQSAFHTVGGIVAWSAVYSRQVVAPGVDHSFFALVKAAFHTPGATFPRAVPLYYLFAGSAVLVFWFRRVRHLPVSNQICILVVLTITLPATSFDYTLSALYIPLALASAAVLRGIPVPGWLFALLALLLSPQTIWWFGDYNFGGALRALGLLALLAFFARPAALGAGTPAASTSQYKMC